MADNEFADGLAKEVAEGWPRDPPDVPDQIRWQASVSHLSRRPTERRSRDAAQWVASSPDLTKAQIPAPRGCRARKSLAGRYYQLLSGHARIGSFLHDRMTGP